MSVKFEEAILPPPEFVTESNVEDEVEIKDMVEFDGEGVEFEEFDIEAETRDLRISSTRSYMYGDKKSRKENESTEIKLMAENSEQFVVEDSVLSEPKSDGEDAAEFRSPESDADVDNDIRSDQLVSNHTLKNSAHKYTATGTVNSTSITTGTGGVSPIGRGTGGASPIVADTVTSKSTSTSTGGVNGGMFLNKAEKLIADEIRDYKRRENELKKIRAGLQSENPQKCTLSSSDQPTLNKSDLSAEMFPSTTSNKQSSEEYSHVEMLSRKFSAFSSPNRKSVSPNFTCTNGLIHEATLRRPKNSNHRGSPLANFDSSSTSTVSNCSELPVKLFGTSESPSSFNSSLHSLEDEDQSFETKSTKSDTSNHSHSEIGSNSSPHLSDTSSFNGSKTPLTTPKRALSKVPEATYNKFLTDNRSAMKGVMERFIASKGKELPTFVRSIKRSQTINDALRGQANVSDQMGSVTSTVSVVEESKRKFICGEFGDRGDSEKKSVEEKIREELASMQRREEELRYNRWKTLASSHSDLLASSQTAYCIRPCDEEDSPDPTFPLCRTSSIPNLIDAE